MGALGLLDATIHSFLVVMQGMVEAGVVEALPSPSPSAPDGKVATPLLMHLHFSYGVAGDRYQPPIWESVARV